MPTTTSTQSWRPTTIFPVRALSSTLFWMASLTQLGNFAQAGTPDDWRSRSIYEVVVDRFALTNGSTTSPCPYGTQQYCGGTFQGIINQLDYIQGMGFTALWVSPVTTPIKGNAEYGEAYHGYWPQDITTINENFGGSAGFAALGEELHKRDMLLMLDVVANNMAFLGEAADVDYSMYKPWNNEKYFHTPCPITDYGNWTLAQICWLSTTGLTLPDLNTELPEVISYYEEWGKEMIANYSIDGFRIDAAKHVGRPFWAQMEAALGIYMVGEVFDAGVDAVCSYQSNTAALSGVLNYAMWYSIVTTFRNGSQPMIDLYYQYTDIVDSCQDSTLLGTFTENQDVARIGNVTTDVSRQMNALAFAMMGDGIPIVYYGAEQGLTSGGDPWNREALWLTKYDTTGPLYNLLKACNVARNAIANRATYDYWSPYWTWKTKVVLQNNDVVGVRKGYDTSVLTIVTNKGVGGTEMGPYTIGDTNFVYGDTIVDLVGCGSMKVGQYGVVNITVPAGGKPMVWIQAKYVWNSTLCPGLNLAQYKDFKSATVQVSGNDGLSLNSAPSTRAGESSMIALFALIVGLMILL